MKKVFLAWCLLIGTVQFPAWADVGRWETHRHPPAEITFKAYERHGYRGGHHHRGWGWAPWVSAAVVGSTIYWANNYPPAPATVIVSPPVVTDPSRVVYFCQTSQQYYPNVPVCNVPWQVVPY